MIVHAKDGVGREASQLRYDILVGVDWRLRLAISDRYTLKPIMEDALEEAAVSLLHALWIACDSPVREIRGFWSDAAYDLTRRAHRYTRILEAIR